MFRRKKLWLAIGATLVAGMGCSNDDQTQLASQASAIPSQMTVAEGGEGGESGTGETGNVVDNDALYLTYLKLMRGHLYVGLELYRSGAQQAAATHMKHPEDELYVKLIPGLKAREAEDFSEQLRILSKIVEGRESVADANDAYQNLLAAIGRAEAAADNTSQPVQAQVLLQLVKTAAEEYDIAVEDGQLVNAHEYQDAMGFVKIAGDMNRQLKELGASDQLVQLIDEQLNLLQPAWPSVIPPEQLDTNPSLLYGVAARIELGIVKEN